VVRQADHLRQRGDHIVVIVERRDRFEVDAAGDQPVDVARVGQSESLRDGEQR
jgi:hypothetical protein